MVLIMTTIRFPFGKASEVAKRYLEGSKKNPPDASLFKTLAMGLRMTKEGWMTIGISDVVKGKYEEVLLRQARVNQEIFSDIEGFTYEVETFMDITEAMPIIGMEAPENR